MTKIEQVGFICLGLMGTSMSNTLIKAGFHLPRQMQDVLECWNQVGVVPLALADLSSPRSYLSGPSQLILLH